VGLVLSGQDHAPTKALFFPFSENSCIFRGISPSVEYATSLQPTFWSYDKTEVFTLFPFHLFFSLIFLV